jgi:hypothetical protein
MPGGATTRVPVDQAKLLAALAKKNGPKSVTALANKMGRSGTYISKQINSLGGLDTPVVSYLRDLYGITPEDYAPDSEPVKEEKAAPACVLDLDRMDTMLRAAVRTGFHQALEEMRPAISVMNLCPACYHKALCTPGEYIHKVGGGNDNKVTCHRCGKCGFGAIYKILTVTD